MTDTSSPTEQAGPANRSPLDVLNDIKHGTLDAAILDNNDRLPLVEFLTGEGATIPEIAQLLKVCDRTIRRDLKAIRTANSLEAGEGFAAEFAGELLAGSRASIARILRVIRDKDCPYAQRIEGERIIMEIRDRTAVRIQSLGFLPPATPRIRAEMTHHVGEPRDFDAIHAEVLRLTSIAGPDDRDGELAKLADVTRVLSNPGNNASKAGGT